MTGAGNRVMRTPAAALCAGLALGCGPGSRAADLPIETFALPADTLVVPYGGALRGAALPDGRWVVVAPDFDLVLIADLRARSSAPLGGDRARAALLHPVSVFTVGDTIFVGDWGNRRTTVWTAAGGLLDSLPAPEATRGYLPRARDAAGQYYFEVPPLPGRDGSGNRDSAAIVRAPSTLDRFDTVARLSPLELARVTRETMTRFEPRIFGGSDQWGVWADGTVWIARIFRNRVVLYQPNGRSTRGPELPDPVYEVTQADRSWHLSNYPPDLRPDEADLPWALVHPPFVAGFSGPGERIWLEKSKVASDSLRRIHLVDREGRLLRILQIIGHGRIIAVGGDRALVAEPAGEAGTRLMEVRIPGSASAPAP